MAVDPPTNTNAAADTVNRVIVATNSAGVKLVQAMIVAEVPWLGMPVIKTIFGYFLGWIDGYLSRAEQSGATFAVIDTQISAEKDALKKATADLLTAQKTGDANAIKKAIQAYADAHSNLVHNNGSATPR